MQLIDEKQVSTILKRSVQTLRNERCMGRGIPYIKLGRSVRYSLEDVEVYLKTRKIQTRDSIIQ